MEAIETIYKGIKFRSRLEARWAYYFDLCGFEWMYESEGFHLSDGSMYLPDFYIPRLNMFVEIKPFKQWDKRWEMFIEGITDEMEEKYTKSYTGEKDRRAESIHLLLLFGDPHDNVCTVLYKGDWTFETDTVVISCCGKYAPVYWVCGAKDGEEDPCASGYMTEYCEQARSYRFEDYKQVQDETLKFGIWLINNVKNGKYGRKEYFIEELYKIYQHNKDKNTFNYY